MSWRRSLDTHSASGRLVINIMVAVSQWEREAIGERTKAVMDFKKGRGERLGNIRMGSRTTEKAEWWPMRVRVESSGGFRNSIS